ncbi:bacteriohemerythrin [Simplicispira psychrophila]|uniref:bacteriohemerythrin n=1 Tax=Simplicispira psychrophila TaxID=80882 RepID=UPI0012EC4747|nr:bacteriohemerythrin [Simplicispira psychrophila]
MAYFIWANDMAIDHGPIDQDHKMLVEQVNQLHTATEAGRGQQVVGQLLGELIRSTVEHIRREEQVMRQLGYPRLKQHQASHVDFVNDLHALQQKFAAGNITVAAQLSTLLRDWLSLHIRRYDRDILTFMQEKRRTKTAA